MATLESVAKSQQKFLINSINDDRLALQAAIADLEAKIIAMAQKRLETDDAGKLLGPKANLKLAQKVHEDVVREFDKKYGAAVRKVTDGYDAIAANIRDNWAELGTVVRYTGVDSDMMDVLRTSYYNEFMRFGDAAQQTMTNAMYGAIAGQSGFEGLTMAISAALTGKLAKNGRPMSTYAATFAQDATMNFHNAVTLKKADDAGIKSFLYYGNLIMTSRPFCIERVGQTFTKEQIESWEFAWKGKSGPALTHRGGYNCRHHWMPINPAWARAGKKEEPTPEKPEEKVEEAAGPLTVDKITISVRTPTDPAKAKKYLQYLAKKEAALLDLLNDPALARLQTEIQSTMKNFDMMKQTLEEFESIRADYNVMGLAKGPKKIVDKLFKVWAEEHKAILILNPAAETSAVAFDKLVDAVRRNRELSTNEQLRALEKLASEYINPNVRFDFTGAAPEAIYDSLKRLKLLSEEFPDVMKRMTYIGTYEGSALPETIATGIKRGRNVFEARTWAHADYSTGEFIGINPAHFGNYEKFSESVYKMESIGWHPLGVDKIDSVVVHEYGHLVQSSFRHKYGMAAEEWENYFSPILRKGRPQSGDQQDKPGFLSDYAIKGKTLEPFAEGFAQLKLTKPSQYSSFTSELGRLLQFEKSATYSEMKSLENGMYYAKSRIKSGATLDNLLTALHDEGMARGGKIKDAIDRYLSIRRP